MRFLDKFRQDSCPWLQSVSQSFISGPTDYSGKEAGSYPDGSMKGPLFPKKAAYIFIIGDQACLKFKGLPCATLIRPITESYCSTTQEPCKVDQAKKERPVQRFYKIHIKRCNFLNDKG